MKSLDSEPHHDIVPSTVLMLDLEESKSILSTLCTLLVHEFVEIHISEASSLSTGGHVIRDGSRIFRCWKYLLIFPENGRTNYALEAFEMLAEYRFLLSPRQALQLA